MIAQHNLCNADWGCGWDDHLAAVTTSWGPTRGVNMQLKEAYYHPAEESAVYLSPGSAVKHDD